MEIRETYSAIRAGVSRGTMNVATMLMNVATTTGAPRSPSQRSPFRSSRPASSDAVTAVDGNRYPGDEVGRRRRQEHRRAGVVVGLAPAAHRRPAQEFVVHLPIVLNQLGHRRRDPPRLDRIDLKVRCEV